MKKDLPSELLEKFFNGECNDEEVATIQRWYDSFPDDAINAYGISSEKKESLRALILDNVNGKIQADPGENIVSIESRRRHNIRIMARWLSACAVLFIVFVFYKNNSLVKPTAIPPEIIVQNKSRKILKVLLNDKSTVWLSPNTVLTYSPAFGRTERKVTLDGEAFFEVTKNRQKPFSVYSGKIITKVWGTSFRVLSLKNADVDKVTVVTGKVSVKVNSPAPQKESEYQLTEKGVMLLPEQEAVYNRTAKKLVMKAHTVDASMDIWHKSSLSFNNVPLSEVFKVLNQKFHVKLISTDEKINKDFLKADFTNENLPSILELLKGILNVTYTVDGNNYVLNSNE
jgi:ferric-dicitrate binding protein FerR (iron transport regulator)